jgi:LuxR family maltose regulon positive regulatory protein
LTAAEGFVRTYIELGPRMADLLRFVDEPGLRGYIASTLAAFPPGIPAPRTLPQLMASPAAALTQREMEVLALLATPMTPEEIAQTLSISYSTVRQHTSHIYEKLGVKKRRHAVLMAAELGLLK